MDWKNFNLNEYLKENILDGKNLLNPSQIHSLNALNIQLKSHGAIIADEVGTGKTRIACALIDFLSNRNDRCAVIIPHGLLNQWRVELKKFTDLKPIIITNYKDLVDSFKKITNKDLNRPVFISQSFRFPIVKSGAPEWKYLLPAVALYLKKEDHDFSKYKNFGRGEAKKYYEKNNFIKNEKNKDQKLTTDNNIVEWAKHLINKQEGLFYNQQKKTLKGKYNFDFAQSSSFCKNECGFKLMESEVLPRMFGHFDLVIIDEAHKSKSEDSILNTILKMICKDREDKSISEQRILGMTATPIELHEKEWCKLLERINIDSTILNDLEDKISAYSKSIKALSQLDKPTEEDFTNFKNSSKAFEKLLAQYVTRRKKNINSHYIKKAKRKKDEIHPHRKIISKNIDLINLNDDIKKWVFLHECMSVTAKGMSNTDDVYPDDNSCFDNINEKIKRLDCYFSRGHTMLNITVSEIFTDDNRNRVDDPNKFDRTKFFAEKWVELNKAQPLYKHPRIREAIKIIEAYTDKNEKVLVFGSFTASIEALNNSLNARYILKAIHQGKTPRIPTSLYKEEKDLFEYEAENLSIPTISDEIFNLYSKRYKNIRNFFNSKIETFLKESKINLQGIDELNKVKIIKLLVARATDEKIFFNIKDIDDGAMINELWKDIEQEIGTVNEAIEQNDVNENKNKEAGFDLFTENALSGSDYSMLLQGKTERNRRSTIQTEFNRIGGFPRVLIAQSQVGKEGLNLHKACKTVLLFNADWNPGVIEQQIGRVDRYESLWQKEMEEWIKKPDNFDAPVIEIIQLNFSGTYDEIQWEKYKERSQTLMFHLFGSLDKKNNWSEEISEKINNALPKFSPDHFLNNGNDSACF